MYPLSCNEVTEPYEIRMDSSHVYIYVILQFCHVKVQLRNYTWRKKYFLLGITTDNAKNCIKNTVFMCNKQHGAGCFSKS
jgi:hypothetical protein